MTCNFVGPKYRTFTVFVSKSLVELKADILKQTYLEKLQLLCIQSKFQKRSSTCPFSHYTYGWI
ncbi:hypothetical protein H5410_023919 [Solanum commersonii]|uniref:Uncharacterized protein n=1 Tax=Solanum commersonii TaxID=4109 RepID=A0A9J5ZKH5_SOLCO|nr:hypothetical protein H5410_023919 [Solanum commersonii]